LDYFQAARAMVDSTIPLLWGTINLSKMIPTNYL